MKIGPFTFTRESAIWWVGLAAAIIYRPGDARREDRRRDVRHPARVAAAAAPRVVDHRHRQRLGEDLAVPVEGRRQQRSGRRPAAGDRARRRSADAVRLRGQDGAGADAESEGRGDSPARRRAPERRHLGEHADAWVDPGCGRRAARAVLRRNREGAARLAGWRAAGDRRGVAVREAAGPAALSPVTSCGGRVHRRRHRVRGDWAVAGRRRGRRAGTGEGPARIADRPRSRSPKCSRSCGVTMRTPARSRRTPRCWRISKPTRTGSSRAARRSCASGPWPRVPVRSGTIVVCPVCRVPFTRYGPTSTTFYRTAQENETCVICREGLDPATWLPTVDASEGVQGGPLATADTQAADAAGCVPSRHRPYTAAAHSYDVDR
jgi:hypothetical protein